MFRGNEDDDDDDDDDDLIDCHNNYTEKKTVDTQGRLKEACSLQTIKVKLQLLQSYLYRIEEK